MSIQVCIKLHVASVGVEHLRADARILKFICMSPQLVTNIEFAFYFKKYLITFRVFFLSKIS